LLNSTDPKTCQFYSSPIRRSLKSPSHDETSEPCILIFSWLTEDQ
jgi:hypothetical protein